MSADNRSVAELLASLCDETISPEEMQRLDRLICTDAAVRRAYLEYLDLHARLSYHFHQPGGVMPLEAGRGREAADSGEWRAKSGESASADKQPSAIGDRQFSIFPIVLDSPLAAQPPLFTLQSPVGGFLFSYAASALILGLALLIGWAWTVAYDQRVAHVVQRQKTPLPAPVPEAPLVGYITGMVDCQWADPADEVSNRDAVSLGRKLALTFGILGNHLRHGGEGHPSGTMYLRGRIVPRRLPLARQTDCAGRQKGGGRRAEGGRRSGQSAGTSEQWAVGSGQ